jgi:hypothetical protein
VSPYWDLLKNVLPCHVFLPQSASTKIKFIENCHSADDQAVITVCDKPYINSKFQIMLQHMQGFLELWQ